MERTLNAVFTPAVFQQLKTALADGRRQDLIEELEKAAARGEAPLTSAQAAELLGVASRTTVKNWLEGGQFPVALSQHFLGFVLFFLKILHG